MFPHVRQSKSYYCGVAVVAALARAAGQVISQDALAMALGTTDKAGTPPQHILAALKSLKLQAELTTGLTPSLLLSVLDWGYPVVLMIQDWGKPADKDYSQSWDDGHYVIATGRKGDTLQLMDPASEGPRTMTIEELLPRWHDRSASGDKYVRAGIVVSVPEGKTAAPAAAPAWAYKPQAAPTTQAVGLNIQQRAQRRDREFELWQRWKNSGGNDMSVLGELYQSLAPLIRQQTLSWTGNLPPAFIEAEVKKNILIGLKTYDPSYLGPTGQPVQLNTHLINRIQKIRREVYKYQNPTRISEEEHLKVPLFQNVTSNLETQLGRPPTDMEISREMSVGIGAVRRLRAGARADMSMVEGQQRWKMSSDEKEQEILDHIQYELSPQETTVFNYVFGRGGMPKLQAKDIATRMGITQPRVSQIKTEIAKKLEYHYGGQKLEALY